MATTIRRRADVRARLTFELGLCVARVGDLAEHGVGIGDRAPVELDLADRSARSPPPAAGLLVELDLADYLAAVAAAAVLALSSRSNYERWRRRWPRRRAGATSA
jgi:hypothetical protein